MMIINDAKESRRNRRGGDTKTVHEEDIMEEQTWRRNHGRGNLEKESGMMHHGGGIVGHVIQESPGITQEALVGTQEAAGGTKRHSGGSQEAPSRNPP